MTANAGTADTGTADSGTADTIAAMRVALIVPTLNEAGSIGRLLAEIPHGVVDRIVVADSGSTDGTADIARRHGAEVIAAGRGYGRACLAAAQAADDVEILVFMDGDGADDPALLSRFVDPIRHGTHDFVIGSRTRGKPAAGSIGWHQRSAGRAFGLGVRLLYGTGYSDMCAFRAIRRDTLLGFGMGEMTYGWNLEMQMRVARTGLRVLELPIDNRCRFGGTSKVAGSLSGSLKAGSRIAATFVRLALAPASDNRLPGNAS